MASASIIPSGKKRTKRVDLASLYKHVVPYITDWENLGAHLGLRPHHLDCISINNAYNPDRAKKLKKWLELECSPTWGNLEDAVNAIENPPAADDEGTVKISGVKFSGHIKELYINTHRTTGKDDWPPDQPKHFTTLVLLQQQNQPTQECVIALEEQLTIGNILDTGSDENNYYRYHQPNIVQEHLRKCKVTKNIFELLSVLENSDINPRTLLIEGAPGIGKTFLLKHIAFEWANDRILKSSHLVFLLCLRDPVVQGMSTISDPMFYFYNDQAASKHVETLCTYLLNSNGKCITFLIDGYDELPLNLQECSFVASIITHQVLPASAVVLTSRPHATAYLHNSVACLITIMGFAEEDRRDYVKESLNSQSDEMLCYLDHHPTIDRLCSIPFYLTVLIFLYKKGFALPENTTQLYRYFICLTIKRYLKKHHLQIKELKDLSDLPEPYSSIINQLAALSYTALSKHGITFTLEEIRTACPDIDTIPEGINGLGLLQAVQHFGFIEETTTVNFLHLSLQEYLAAYHIAHLPPEQELFALHNGFFAEKYRNTFSLYLGLTKGQNLAFKYFLSGGERGTHFGTTSMLLHIFISNIQNKAKISPLFLESIDTILTLFMCFYEAGDKTWCDAIVNCSFFCSEGKPAYVNYSNKMLTNKEVEDLSILLAYRQEWSLLHFEDVVVPNLLLQTLHQTLVVQTPIINTIKLISTYSMPLQEHYIAEIVISCKTKVLDVTLNDLDDSDWIIQMLSHKNCVLEELHVDDRKITSTKVVCKLLLLKKVHLKKARSATIKELFCTINASKTFSKLRDLTIHYAYDEKFIDDQVAYEIATCLQHNMLTCLIMSKIKVSDEACPQIINALEYNTTLQRLELTLQCSKCHVNKIKSRVTNINGKRHLFDKDLPKVSCDDMRYNYLYDSASKHIFIDISILNCTDVPD